jgi:hypothetical protein
MAIRAGKTGEATMTRSSVQSVAIERPKEYHDWVLFLGLIAMLSWIAYDGLSMVHWVALAHMAKTWLAVIW